MASTKTLTLTIVLSLTIVAIPCPTDAATMMWEEDYRMICNDSGQKSLPRKLVLRQVIDDSFFGDALLMNAVMYASYIFRLDVNKGKVVAMGLLLKSDGSEMPLPKLAGKMKGGDADKAKPLDLAIEAGDMIEWTIRLKGLAPLEGFDCWTLEVGIAATDAALTQSNLMSVTSLRSTKR